jgi:hypothetical protein
VRQRTQCVNALRGHLLEYGYVFPKGITHVATLVALVEDLQSSLTLKSLGRRYLELHDEIVDLDIMIVAIVDELAPASWPGTRTATGPLRSCF